MRWRRYRLHGRGITASVNEPSRLRLVSHTRASFGYTPTFRTNATPARCVLRTVMGGDFRRRPARESAIGSGFGHNNGEEKSKHQHAKQNDDDDIPTAKADIGSRFGGHKIPALRIGIDGAHESSLPARKNTAISSRILEHRTQARRKAASLHCLGCRLWRRACRYASIYRTYRNTIWLQAT